MWIANKHIKKIKTDTSFWRLLLCDVSDLFLEEKSVESFSRRSLANMMVAISVIFCECNNEIIIHQHAIFLTGLGGFLFRALNLPKR